MIYPLLWLVASSFKSNDTMFTNTYSLIPQTWDAIKNYASGFEGIGGVPFSTFFFNSVFVTVVGTALTIFCSLLAAYALARIDFAGSKLWFGCVIMTLMIPNQVMIVPQYIILKQLNLVDTKISLILPWAFGYAFFIFQMVQFFRGIPKDLDEAAMLDGCGKIGTLFRILTPIAQPSIITCSIFAFYWIWQDFFQPLIFISSPKNFTIPLALNMYLDPNSYNNYGGLFAMSVVSIIPVIVFFISFQKYIVEGIATDGIKG
jgi:multiple sugar transport system permease protein